MPEAEQYGRLTDVFADRDYDALDGEAKFTVAGSGFRWLAAVRAGDSPQLR